MLKRNLATFSAPPSIGEMQIADCPMTDQLASILDELDVISFKDVYRVSLQDLRRLGDKTGCLALELGCLIRSASRGEFGRAYDPVLKRDGIAVFWYKGSKEVEEVAVPSTPPAGGQGNTFSIPDKWRAILMSHIQMSTRLRHALEWGGLETLGGLHNVTGNQILTLEGVGAKGLEELRRVVQSLLEGRLLVQPPVPREKHRKEPERFLIPQSNHHLSPYEFPLSRRLDGVLRLAGIACFGNLNGLGFHDLLRISNCGPKTVRELSSVIADATRGLGESRTV